MNATLSFVDSAESWWLAITRSSDGVVPRKVTLWVPKLRALLSSDRRDVYARSGRAKSWPNSNAKKRAS